MSITNPNDPSGSVGTSPTTTAPTIEDKVKSDMAAVTETAKSDFNAVKLEAATQIDALRTEASDQVDSFKQQAQEQIGEVTDKAKTFAGEQKDLAADQLSGVSAALNKVADELQGDQASIAGYTRQLAGGIGKFADTVKTKQVDDILAMAQDFGRKQPAAFLGAAALAGFVASRFALASTHRGSEAAASTAASPKQPTESAVMPGAYPTAGGLDTAPVKSSTIGGDDARR